MEVTTTVNYSYGSICCLIFLIGTLGNISSFLYFKSKKRDISNVIYMLITANDIVVSITVLPVGISFLTQGKPGLIFGNKYGCETWYFIWKMAIKLSVFLVLCLCTIRTISLLKPFNEQKIRYFVLAVMIMMVINLAFEATFLLRDITRVIFSPLIFRCGWYFYGSTNAELIVYAVNYNICYISPAFVVVISCVISVVVLTRRSRNVQQRELQQSRNRATVTILLFALLYGVCNIPWVLSLVIYTATIVTDDWEIMDNFYRFDKHFFYYNATFTILQAANSAANPILYFWRMPALREYIMSGIRRMLGLNREVRMPALREYIMSGMRRMLGLNREVRMPALREYIMSGVRRMLGLNREVRMPALREYIMSGIRRMLGLNREVRMPALREYIMSGVRRMLGLNEEVRRAAVQQAETQPCNRVVENINIAQQLPASGHLETGLCTDVDPEHK